MAGLDLGHRGGVRRNVIVDIEPIPMIDLMMVMISFLLITAVWSHMARMDVAANVPAPGDPMTTPVAEKVLHLEIKDDLFILSWRHEKKVITRTEISRRFAPT
ncbi:biopolymer transporter ExbD [Pendulispora brunnea]|uniref:Biopolymer transporter ExbD n=1 Tax=Pendulispora brunnea TaxID=2905690 RepID=A0ABZ2K2B3_9BACT